MRTACPALLLSATTMLGCGSATSTVSPEPSVGQETGPDIGAAVDSSPDSGLPSKDSGAGEDAPPIDLWGACKPRHWESPAGSPQLDPGSRDGKLTLLPDGRVMIGVGEGVYDPVRDEYEEVVPFGVEWDGAAITVLADGISALVAGGGYLAEDTSTTCLLDLTHLDHGCRYVSTLLSQRSSPWAQLRPDGKVFVLGGAITSSEGHPIPSAEMYDPIADRWTAVPAPDEVLLVSVGADGSILEDGRWFVLAGNHAYFYDPRLESWTRASDPPPLPGGFPDALDKSILLADGRVMIAGGFTRDDWWSTSIYDPKDDTWTPPAVIGRGLGPVVIHDLGCGRVYLLAEGNRKEYWGARTFLYAFESNTWSELPDPPDRLGWLVNTHGVVLPDGRLMAGFGSVVSMAAKYNQLLVLTDTPSADGQSTPSDAR